MFLSSRRPMHTDAKSIEHIDGLYGYAMILTRNHVEAEDLVQETYLRAIRSIDTLRPDSNLRGWLFTILRNIWLNQLRKLRNGPQMEAIDDDDGISEPSKNSYEIYVNKVEIERLRAAIQKLPIEFREVILLREYEELSYREIAVLLDCPIGTVMSRLGRARAKLRAILIRTAKFGASETRNSQ